MIPFIFRLVIFKLGDSSPLGQGEIWTCLGKFLVLLSRGVVVGLLAAITWRPGMLNDLQYKAEPLTTKNYPTQYVNSIAVGKPWFYTYNQISRSANDTEIAVLFWLVDNRSGSHLLQLMRFLSFQICSIMS